MRKIAFIYLGAGILFFSCQKEDEKVELSTETSIGVVNDYAISNQIFQDIVNNSADYVLQGESMNDESKSISKWAGASSNDQPVISIVPYDLTTFPKTTTLDFGSGILCKDGVTRKGIIKIVSSNWYREEGSVHKTSFQNYYHENYQVDGLHVVTNLGVNEDGFLRYGVTVDHGKITDHMNKSIEYTERSFRTWVAGSETPLYIWDDEYLLEGTQKGSGSSGLDYSLTIAEPVHFILSPRHINSGVINFSIGRINDIILDYTQGTVSIFGVSYPMKKS